ncbi:lipid scramblase CLPTM1L [Arctopsyche grandis]|uniref:lipid scramblase CLPTM1L n=1 Tax=Arctopsyche grandis TaxID=121162 RepID=UPI00406D9E62
MWSRCPGVGTILSVLAAVYAVHAVWSLAEVWLPPDCSPPRSCLKSTLVSRPHQDLLLFTRASHSNSPSKILEIKQFDYLTPFSKHLSLEIPYSTRKNGTMFMYIYLANNKNAPWTWDQLRSDAAIEQIPIVVYNIPQAATFNLLRDKSSEKKSNWNSIRRPVSHLKSFVSFSILTDPILIPADAPPPELVNHLRVTKNNQYLPLIQYNFLKSRLQDLVEITSSSHEMNMTLDYSPASIGKMKFLVHIEIAMQSLTTMGFTHKDIDDVKGMFADTNLYLLCGTIIISSIHLLFDVLAFKNDISFWKAKKSMAGLSVRTVLWRAFSQTVVTLYLFDENTSMLVLVPSGIAAIIELWKVKKILHIDIDWRERKLRVATVSEDINKAEMRTREVDAEAMQYLSYILYPICVCGAVYSLIYQPHKSWYSWTLHSMVNGVYAFGFIFMLPQLFINYRLKSVAALPWRAFMYKAFNTFIDDIFAFIITMPIAHRMACFRDDIVFLIYLYQRWLYPVDKNRVDDSYSIEETVSEPHRKKE